MPKALGLGEAVARDANRIAGAVFVDGKIDLLAERLQLLDRGRTIDVGGNQAASAALAP